MSLEMTSILPRPIKTADLTTFGGRLRHAMEKRSISSAGLAQVLARQGFAVKRKNIDQWKLIDENTWRETSEIDPITEREVTTPRKGLENSRGPYPNELQIMVVHLHINGMWLMVGGAIPMERGGGLPITAEDMQEVWKADKATRFLISHVMAMNDQSRQAIIQYLAATNQIDFLNIPEK